MGWRLCRLLATSCELCGFATPSVGCAPERLELLHRRGRCHGVHLIQAESHRADQGVHQPLRDALDGGGADLSKFSERRPTMETMSRSDWAS